MTLTSDGWFDWAIRKPGPAWKQNGGVNPSTFFVGHSAEGYSSVFYDIMQGSARKSVHLFNPQQGPVEQLYPITVQCWASGNPTPNNNALTMELEGVAGEPMNPNQYGNVVRVLSDWSWAQGFSVYRYVDFSRRLAPGGLTEHKQWFATACPSDRYPWALLVEAVNTPPARLFIAGDEQGGLEKRGKQTIIWNNGVAGNAIGDFEGLYPGSFWHLAGDQWVELAH